MAASKRKKTTTKKKGSDRFSYPDHSMLISIRDNVLDDEDFPIARVFFNEHEPVIEYLSLIKQGAYTLFDGFGPQPGWTLDELVTWIERDPTGERTEIWNCWMFASDSFVLREGWKGGRAGRDIKSFMARKLWPQIDDYDTEDLIESMLTRSKMWTLMKGEGLDIYDRIKNYGPFKIEALNKLFIEVCRSKILHEAALSMVEGAKVFERLGVPKYGAVMRDHATLVSKDELEVNDTLINFGLRRLLGMPLDDLELTSALEKEAEEDVLI